MNTHTIGFICPSTSWGGLEMNVYHLAMRLKRRGHRIIVYGNPLSILYQKLQTENITVWPLVSRSKFRDIFLALSLARMIRRDDVNLAVLHVNRNFILAVLAKMFCRKRIQLVYMQHMHVGGTKRDFFHTWLYSQLDCWITPLEGFKSILTEKTKLPPHKIAVIPHGFDLRRFTDDKPDKATARIRMAVPDHVTVVGVVGRLDPKKGQHILVEACHRLLRQGRTPHVLIVGDKTMGEQSHYAEQIEQLVRKYGLEGFVHFRPHMSEIEYAYAAMDIFVLTSQSETYGMVTLEAMASGLPVIGTNAGGTKEIIKDGVNGLLVEPYDIEQLEKALIRVLDDHELSRDLAERARRDVAAGYSSQYQCDLLEELFKKLSG